jgi:hypothetical protein
VSGERIEVEGLKELIRDLKKADQGITVELKKLHKAAGDEVATEAKTLVPRRSGRLANSIRAGAQQQGAVVRAGGGGIPYAKVIHFGWPQHNIRPQPFLYDALDKRRGDVQAAYERALQKLVDRTFGS